MRKKILLLIFAFFAIILPIINVKADLNCIYQYSGGSGDSLSYFKVVFEGNKDYPYSGEVYIFTKFYRIEDQNIYKYSESYEAPKVLFDNECPKKVKVNFEYAVDTYYVIKDEEFKTTPHEDGGSYWYTADFVESYDDNARNASKVYCGREEEGRITGIPKKIPQLTSMIVTIIQIAIPIILVLFGSIDLFKGITAGKEDEIKKGQQMFIKRLIVGALIFFVVVIVKFLISVIAETNKDNIADCVDCFISNDCEEM